jgi:hypothetical protein
LLWSATETLQSCSPFNKSLRQSPCIFGVRGRHIRHTCSRRETEKPQSGSQICCVSSSRQWHICPRVLLINSWTDSGHYSYSNGYNCLLISTTPLTHFLKAQICHAIDSIQTGSSESNFGAGLHKAIELVSKSFRFNNPKSWCKEIVSDTRASCVAVLSDSSPTGPEST